MSSQNMKSIPYKQKLYNKNKMAKLKKPRLKKYQITLKKTGRTVFNYKNIFPYHLLRRIYESKKTVKRKSGYNKAGVWGASEIPIFF